MIHTKSNKISGAKTEVKVIKKAGMGTMEKPFSVNKRPEKEGERQLVATVMNWVSDFETRRVEEIRLAIERFQHM